MLAREGGSTREAGESMQPGLEYFIAAAAPITKKENRACIITPTILEEEARAHLGGLHHNTALLLRLATMQSPLPLSFLLNATPQLQGTKVGEEEEEGGGNEHLSAGKTTRHAVAGDLHSPPRVHLIEKNDANTRPTCLIGSSAAQTHMPAVFCGVLMEEKCPPASTSHFPPSQQA